MAKNKKHTENTLDHLVKAATNLGFTAMSLATVISMAELAERQGHKAVAVMQPQPAYVTIDNNEQYRGGAHVEELRRGAKEEIRHTSASYGVQMRQHSVSGNR